jgi:GAF domain-containing protein
MHKPSPHPKEEERLNIVKALNILDTKPEERFDKITKMATERLHVPISTITIIDKDREWFKSYKGLSRSESPRDVSFCGHALLMSDIFMIEDTLKDERFENHPQTKAPLPIRFYAGINLKHKQSGFPVGVFCIKDYKPRTLHLNELEIFLELAKEAEYQLNKEKTLHSKDN